jgi:hypothetical protein
MSMGSPEGLPISFFDYLNVLEEESRPVWIAKKVKIESTDLLSAFHHWGLLF